MPWCHHVDTWTPFVTTAPVDVLAPSASAALTKLGTCFRWILHWYQPVRRILHHFVTLPVFTICNRCLHCQVIPRIPLLSVMDICASNAYRQIPRDHHDFIALLLIKLVGVAYMGHVARQDEITYSLPNVNGAIGEVWQWISNFI